jgi:glycerol uptake facilitator protein
MKLKDILTVTFGTFVLIILGDGVVANVGLAPRLAGSAYNWNTITIGWAVAVFVSIWVSGGDHNPAFTLAGALRGSMPLSQAFMRILCQMVGAFLGAGAVYLVYRDGLVAAGMPNVWSTGPGSTFGATFWGGAGAGAASAGPYSLITASLTEFFGVLIIAWSIRAGGDSRNSNISRLGGLIVAMAVLGVGLCLGGPSGYSLNPARDLGPRLFGLLAGTQGLFDGIYWLIPPVLVPFIAAPIGYYLYDVLFLTEPATA